MSERLKVVVQSSFEEYQDDAIEAGADKFIHRLDSSYQLWQLVEDFGLTRESVVVVVDDMSDSLGSIARTLELRDLLKDRIHLFTSASEALVEIRKLEPDLVITDVEMPGMNGLELTRKIREMFPEYS